ncbi:MAG: flagellar basal body P-ring formation chaperone FlgA [candidate division Zixibacteria bacterium]|nr:flagellar basal body P-ring formation chaperone FlgA [candidate division Zixibacteria bacterium]
MNKDIGNCLSVLALLLLLCAGTLRAESLEGELARGVAALYNLDTAKTTIEIQKHPLTLDSCAYDSLNIIPLTQTPPRGSVSFQVILYRDRQIVGQGQVRFSISCYDWVMVTDDRIKRNEIITPDKCHVERKEITWLTEQPIKSFTELDGRWTKRSINKAQIISSGMLEKIPDIVTGKEISILYQTSGLEISTRGTAMAPGYIGADIRVKNNQSGKIINGTVIDGGTVRIGTI